MNIETLLIEKLRRLGHRPGIRGRASRSPVDPYQHSARTECAHCGQWGQVAVTKFGGELGLRMTGPAITEPCLDEGSLG